MRLAILNALVLLNLLPEITTHSIYGALEELLADVCLRLSSFAKITA